MSNYLKYIKKLKEDDGYTISELRTIINTINDEGNNINKKGRKNELSFRIYKHIINLLDINKMDPKIFKDGKWVATQKQISIALLSNDIKYMKRLSKALKLIVITMEKRSENYKYKKEYEEPYEGYPLFTNLYTGDYDKVFPIPKRGINLAIELNDINMLNTIIRFIDGLVEDQMIKTKCLSGYMLKKKLGSTGGGELGAGAHGKVVLGCLDDNCMYAVKIIDLTEEEFYEEAERTELFDKLGIGPKFMGSCTVGMYGYIIMEKWDRQLDTENDIISKKIMDKLFNQIKTLHRNGYIHLDIMPKNILVKEGKNGEVIDITLTDFGISDETDIFDENESFFDTIYNYHVQNYGIEYKIIIEHPKLSKTPMWLKPINLKSKKYFRKNPELMDFMILSILRKE